LIRNHISYADFFILTPLPGTELRKKLERDNRIISNNWSDYDSLRVVFEPRLMTAQELNDGLWKAYQRFYSIKNILRRLLLGRKTGVSARKIFSNFYYRSLVGKRRHPIYGS
jgi:radical SAM superfamily enzyme YgiQ (UPF0313 family)